MMKLYPENYDVQIDVLFTDASGASLTVSAVQAQLFNGDDELIADFDNVSFDPADGKAVITVPATDNILGEGELSAARILRVELTTDAGPVRHVHAYIVEETRLEILNNTFLTLEAAEVLARDYPRLAGWAAADSEKKAAALINAYSRLSRIQLSYEKPKEECAQTIIQPYFAHDRCDNWRVVIKPGDWGVKFSKADFLAMPVNFRKALRAAQLIEANEVLTENPYEQRHRAGVISETVGESSIMLRGGKLELGISSEALRALTGFVYYSIGIARA